MKPALDAAGMLTADDGCLDTVSAIWLGYVGKQDDPSMYPSLAAYRRAVAASQGQGNKSKALRVLQ
jgi:hypothetical protein